MENKNSNSEIGLPCLLLLVIFNGAEQTLPVITMDEGLEYSILTILMKMEAIPICSKTDQFGYVRLETG